MKKKIYITTAIDYANAVVHVGQAYEKILADSIARYERIQRGAENVLFTTGTDEHGTTTEKAAEAKGVTPFEHVTDISKQDKQQIDSLNISYDRFIRTTDEDHKKFVTDFFMKLVASGDIYKANYEGYYCEGCESTKTLSELNEDKQCPYHPTREIQLLKEENYFFKLSKYEDFLRKIIEEDILYVRPEGKKKEMLAFLDSGLQDITITRPKQKVSWGITAPNDSEQVIYVWPDALTNYLTESTKKGFWDDGTEVVHLVGKDIIRWHVLLWPAMLKSTGYRLPDKIYIHGFINLEGQKISKSTGNVVYPTELVEKYGEDAVRYYLLKYGPITEDSDLTTSHFEDVYNGELANGLGNTVARIAKLAERSGFDFPIKEGSINKKIYEPISDFRTDKVITNIWQELTNLDKHINENEPWAIKNDEKKLKDVLLYEVNVVRCIAYQLQPFLPAAAEKILNQFGSEKIDSGAILFPRIS